MTSPVTRYRQRPPEVDALLVSTATADIAVSWLRSYGRDAYRVGGALHVLPTPVGAPGFDVPFGHHLIREVGRGGWAPVPPGHLVREYVIVPGQEPPWEQRFAAGSPAPPRHARGITVATPPHPFGQPRGGI